MAPNSEKSARSDARTTEFERDGTTVLKAFFDPEPLSREVDESLALGHLEEGAGINSGVVGNTFQYVPMMCEHTPVSLRLIADLAAPARELLGREVLPVRAKGTRYFGGTAWHRDLELDLASAGFASYLEPLDASSGALRVVKGSHRAPLPEFPDGMPLPEGTPLLEGMPQESNNRHGEAIETEPGDVLVFDEHLWHSSVGGRTRRQWRIDFIGDPENDEEEALTRQYFDQIFQVGWDGGYDVDRFPSYGRYLREAGLPWVGRLRELGALDAADGEEDFVRTHRLADAQRPGLRTGQEGIPPPPPRLPRTPGPRRPPRR
ncbi:MAG: phytanoyl-CoA dioxygenase family protein [Acidimicrobiales bacterium]